MTFILTLLHSHVFINNLFNKEIFKAATIISFILFFIPYSLGLRYYLESQPAEINIKIPATMIFFLIIWILASKIYPENSIFVYSSSIYFIIYCCLFLFFSFGAKNIKTKYLYIIFLTIIQISYISSFRRPEDFCYSEPFKKINLLTSGIVSNYNSDYKYIDLLFYYNNALAVFTVLFIIYLLLQKSNSKI